MRRSALLIPLLIVGLTHAAFADATPPALSISYPPASPTPSSPPEFATRGDAVDVCNSDDSKVKTVEEERHFFHACRYVDIAGKPPKNTKPKPWYDKVFCSPYMKLAAPFQAEAVADGDSSKGNKETFALLGLGITALTLSCPAK
jgi:hypothetical protein